MTIKVKEPESGITRKLNVERVKNFTFPGWVIFIPEQRNVLLFLQNGKWQTIPEKISSLYAESIGKKLLTLP